MKQLRPCEGKGLAGGHRAREGEQGCAPSPAAMLAQRHLQQSAQ